MNTPVISADAAQKLNQKVQEEIDPRLFLCCNYHPTASYAIGEDGKYMTSIQDLYKFAIDSNCIIKVYKRFLPWDSLSEEERDTFKRFDAVLKQVDLLRAVTDHNNSPQNGYMEKERAERYGEWLYEVLGKPTPETQADFAQLNQQLADMAADLLQGLHYFVACAARQHNRNEIVADWIDRTLRWYCSPTKQEIYKGQIMDAYIANTRAYGRDYPELYQIRRLTPKIQAWVRDAFLAPIEKEQKEADDAIEMNQKILNGSTPMVQALRAKMTPENWAIMESRCQEQIAQNEQKKETLRWERQELECKIGQNPLDFLFEGLEDQLRRTMAKCETDGIEYTLLPQDLLQIDVEWFFQNVPSRNGDF